MKKSEKQNYSEKEEAAAATEGTILGTVDDIITAINQAMADSYEKINRQKEEADPVFKIITEQGVSEATLYLEQHPISPGAQAMLARMSATAEETRTKPALEKIEKRDEILADGRDKGSKKNKEIAEKNREAIKTLVDDYFKNPNTATWKNERMAKQIHEELKRRGIKRPPKVSTILNQVKPLAAQHRKK